MKKEKDHKWYNLWARVTDSKYPVRYLLLEILMAVIVILIFVFLIFML